MFTTKKSSVSIGVHSIVSFLHAIHLSLKAITKPISTNSETKVCKDKRSKRSEKANAFYYCFIYFKDFKKKWKGFNDHYEYKGGKKWKGTDGKQYHKKKAGLISALTHSSHSQTSHWFTIKFIELMLHLFCLVGDHHKKYGKGMNRLKLETNSLFTGYCFIRLLQEA